MNAPVTVPSFSVAWRPPFAVGAATHLRAPEGATLAEIVAAVGGLPERFAAHGVIRVNDVAMPREIWHLVRPKASRPARPVVVTLHLPLGKSGDGSSTAKSVVGLVAAIALSIAAPGIGTALGGALGGFFATAVGTKALTAAVGIIGALAIAALTAPPAASQSKDSSATTPQAASVNGNVADPGGALSRVIGTRKVAPKLVAYPIVELIDGDEYGEAVFGLQGPHALSDIRVDGMPIEDADDVDYETREGWADDAALSIVTRQGRMIAPNVELTGHTVNSDNQNLLKHAASPEHDLPVWQGTAGRDSPDEIWLHLLLPSGLAQSDTPTNDKNVPFRIRIRKRGDVSWINLPEIHLSGRKLQQTRRQVKLIWGTAPEGIATVPTKAGWVAAFTSVPAQNTAPIRGGWSAHSAFIGSGNTYLYNSVEGASGVARTQLSAETVAFYLDEATFPKGIYDIQVMRGCAYDASTFTKSTYGYSSTIYDFFGYYNETSPRIPLSRENITDQVYLTRVVNVWNQAPVSEMGDALIAVKLRNRAVNNLTVVASGYVQDWDGSDWTSWSTPSNPAAHYRDVLSGGLNLDPLPADLRDDYDPLDATAGLVGWRTMCTENGWTCDAIIEDMRTQDVLSLLASCGYARPCQSEIYGVTVDRDRSGDDPIQLFTTRNLANFRIEKAFSQVADGLIVNYVDVDSDYEQEQAVVYRSGYDGGAGGLLETVTYDGLVDAAAIEARALFDLDQARARSTFYRLEADMEAVVCRRGDLVALNHDTLTTRAAAGVVRQVLRSGSNITGLELDTKVPVWNEPDMHAVTDVHAVADMHKVGMTTGLALRRNDGSVSTHQLSDASGEVDTLTFTTPFADPGTIEGLDDTDGRTGALVQIGPLGTEYLRLLVQAIAPNADATFSLTLVDEAPDLVRYAA